MSYDDFWAAYMGISIIGSLLFLITAFTNKLSYINMLWQFTKFTMMCVFYYSGENRIYWYSPLIGILVVMLSIYYHYKET